MSDCDRCGRSFRDGYNLKRHKASQHPPEMEDDEYETRSTAADDEEEDTASENEEDADQKDGEESESSEEDDEEESTDDDVFDELLKKVYAQFADERELMITNLVDNEDETRQEAEVTVQDQLREKYRKAFREELRAFLLHWRDLKQHPTYKAIMKTAKALREEEDYDYDEAIAAAVSRRKHLLNRLVPDEPMQDEDEDSDESIVEEVTT